MGVDKNRRPVLADDFGNIRVTASTAPSTALAPRGVISLNSTSTGGPVVYTLASAPKRGRRFSVSAVAVGATSAMFHVNAGTGIGFGASSADMLALSTAGDSAMLQGLSTSLWAITGSHGAVTFSTST